MAGWMNRAKDTLSKIIDNIHNEYPDMKIRVAFVGYRDFRYTPHLKPSYQINENQYAIKDFTENIDEVKLFISTQTA